MSEMARRQEWEKDEEPARLRQEEEDDGVPYDPDAIRARLADRIARLNADADEKWRQCREPVCRRHRSCKAPAMPCWVPYEPRELSPEEEERIERAMERTRRVLRRMVDRAREQREK